MKRLLPLLAVLVGLGSSCALAQESKSPMRTWTSSVGTKVEAELLSLTGDQVSLKTKEGKILRLHLHKLSKADQKLLSEMDSRDAKAPTLDRVTLPLSEADLERLLKQAVDVGSLQSRGGFFFLGSSTKPYSGWAKRLYPSGELDTLKQFQRGQQNGLEIGWHKNGQKSYEGYAKEGKAEGPVRAWHENGQKHKEFAFKDGKPDGPATGWHDNGQRRFEQVYRGGAVHGPYVGWHRNGQKHKEFALKDGKPDGPATAWHDNGQRHYEQVYTSGLLHGPYKSWHANGQKKGEGAFEEGKAVSMKHWNSKGEEVDTSEEAEK